MAATLDPRAQALQNMVSRYSGGGAAPAEEQESENPNGVLRPTDPRVAMELLRLKREPQYSPLTEEELRAFAEAIVEGRDSQLAQGSQQRVM